MTNPLFPTDDQPKDDNDNSYLLPDKRNRRVEPAKPDKSNIEAAANVARAKLSRLYTQEPDAKTEEKEVEAEVATDQPRSKHQEFMYQLSTSGKSLADIQTEWHNYYTNLPDHEKREVWQEFYENNDQASHYQQQVSRQPEKPTTPEPTGPVVGENLSREELEQIAENTPVSQIRKTIERRKRAAAKKLKKYTADKAATKPIKQKIRRKAKASAAKKQPKRKLQAKDHFKSLLFGLGIGCIVIIITLFSFFNEIIIAPFIQPSRVASATPLILGADSVSPTKIPEVIIPKINVEIPLVGFELTGTNEAAVENDLEDGVVHYPTTVLPGQKGNAAFFGHSSNNIFNPGHYKFAFTLLHELVPGDTFYLTYNHKVYAYQVFEKKIVAPNDVAVLQQTHGKAATAALITCDPPGTSNNRLVVWGEQVSPSPSKNTKSSQPKVAAQPAQLFDNGPSLWDRMIHGITSWF